MKENTGKIREPVQKRSIEKKNRIIHAGITLICEEGYQGITTADIAKRAGVSTGIIYNYFKDKKDILVSGLNDVYTIMQAPLFDVLKQADNSNFNFRENMDKLLDNFLEAHRKFLIPHQELLALAATDPDINKIFEDFENVLIEKCVEIFENSGVSFAHIRERIHLAYHMIELYCHESVLNPNPNVDYDVLRNEILVTLDQMLYRKDESE